MDKKSLRAKYKEQRKLLTENQIQDYSITIANQLLDLPIWDKAFFHLFLPIEAQKEIDTSAILHILQGKDKHVVVSKSDFKTYTMSSFLLSDDTVLRVNNYGIPEPENGIPLNDDLIDVIFVPLLAFDENGNRVGYGKGFYDRFLAKCKPECIKIGLSFFEVEKQVIKIEDTDSPLDYCITPNAVYKF